MSTNQPVVMAPVLQTMPEYIENHFYDELMEELEVLISMDHKRDIDLGLKELSDEALQQVKLVFERSSGKIVWFDLWQIDRTHLKADMRLRFRVGKYTECKIPHFVVRYIDFSTDFELDDGIRRVGGIEVFPQSFPKRSCS